MGGSETNKEAGSVSGNWGEGADPALGFLPQLIPMISFIGLGMGSAALYLLRLALRSPDVW